MNQNLLLTVAREDNQKIIQVRTLNVLNFRSAWQLNWAELFYLLEVNWHVGCCCMTSDGIIKHVQIPPVGGMSESDMAV